jgi:hypothetical protein
VTIKSDPKARFLRVPLAISERDDLSSTAKLLFGALAMHAGGFDGKRPAYPNQTTLAAELGLGVRAIRDALGELKELGLVEVHRGRFRGAKARGNVYYLRPLNRQYSAADNRKNSAGENRKNTAGHNRQNSAAGKEQIKRTSERSRDYGPVPNDYRPARSQDLDYLLTHRQKRDARADESATDWPRLAALVEELLGQKPTKNGLSKIISATPTKTETEALEAIEDAKRRGYDASHKNGPHSMSWFVSVVQNYWADKLRRALPPRAAVPAPDPEVFDRMTAAIDLVEEPEDWPELEVLKQLKRTGDRK